MLDKLGVLALLLVTLGTLVAVEFLSNIVIHPNCCVESVPSRATSKAWEELSTPGDVGIEQYEKLKFDAQEGERTLEGWLIPAQARAQRRREEDRTAAVLVHDAGSDMRQMLALAAEVHNRMGWVTLLFNHQETETSAFGRYAASDVLAAVSFVRNESHAFTRGVKRVVVMGVSVGAAAGMFASIKDTSVDAFVSISMPMSAHQYWQAGLQRTVEELQHSVPNRLASNIPVGWQAEWTMRVIDWVYTPASSQVMQESNEQANFMAKLEYMSKGWFLDLTAHLTVIRGAGFRAWLQGVADPHKAIHRIQPRGYYLAHGQVDEITPLQLVQSLYNRAGVCLPKLARIVPEAGHELDLRRDDKFWATLKELLQPQ